MRFPTQPAHLVEGPIVPHPLHRFLMGEDGSVSVDWIVLTAGIVGLGVASIVLVQNGIAGLAMATSDAVTEYGDASGAENAGAQNRGAGNGANNRGGNAGAGQPMRGTDPQRGSARAF